jgi:hypothetical protein
MVTVLLIVVAGNVCWEAIDLSHNEESALNAYGDHEDGNGRPSAHSAHRQEIET